MRKEQQKHPAKFFGYNPSKFYLLEESDLRSKPPEEMPEVFNVFPQSYEMHPLISPAAMLTVRRVDPADVKDGELVIYRAGGFSRPTWHLGFAQVRPKTVTLMMLQPYGPQVFDRMHYVIGGKPTLRPDEVLLKVMQVHTAGYLMTVDRFRGCTSLLLLASGIDPAGKKRAKGRAA
jgi:hypothetical protein